MELETWMVVYAALWAEPGMALPAPHSPLGLEHPTPLLLALVSVFM